MTVPVLHPATLDRLVKFAGMMGSDHAGERAAAALKATNLLRDAGLTWADLLRPQAIPPQAAPASPPRGADHDTTVRWALGHAACLNPWELRFLHGVLGRPGLSSKQARALDRIVKHLRTTPAQQARA